MITDENESVSRVIRMLKENKVTAVTGRDIEVHPDSICLHGDSPKAVLFAKKIRTALEEKGIETAPIEKVIA